MIEQQVVEPALFVPDLLVGVRNCLEAFRFGLGRELPNGTQVRAANFNVAGVRQHVKYQERVHSLKRSSWSVRRLPRRLCADCERREDFPRIRPITRSNIGNGISLALSWRNASYSASDIWAAIRRICRSSSRGSPKAVSSSSSSSSSKGE